MSSFTVVLAQINPLVGDIPGNTQRVIDATRRAQREFNADIVVFPELTLMGYPPEDLVLRASVEHRVAAGLERILTAELSPTVILGYPKVSGSKIYNQAGVIQNGRLAAEYAKQCLPNYLVFDDKRYFWPGNDTCVLTLNGVETGVLICEDVWQPGPIARAREAGAEYVVVLNGSPFHVDKVQDRQRLLQQRAREAGIPIVFVNQVGGQDELVFDGASMVVDGSGHVCASAPAYAEGLYPVTFEVGDRRDVDNKRVSAPAQTVAPLQTTLESIYEALVLGLRDYVHKNGFKGVILGLSGGIDSALVLTIAVDALGSDAVEAVMMPYRYTSQMSRDDAAELARRLEVRYRSIAIESIVEQMSAALADEFAGLGVDKTEENIQSRVRGNLLMAISNKKGYLVLTTGNKSEMAVGYATLYGDMAGGFGVLKDVAKTRVYELAEFRNRDEEVIPRRIIERPPSAELAPDQIDTDSLPPYGELDEILAAYIERDESAEQIIAQGHERETVERVLRMVDINEYKRRQAPIGPRITKRGFGRDRRYPITSGWKIGD